MASTATPLQAPEWTLGDRLRKARQSAGLNQEQMAQALAQQLGISVTRESVSKWEQDAAQPRHVMDVVKKWSEITKVRLEWILGFSASVYEPIPRRLALAPAHT